jgi:uncharacterized protein
MSAIPTFEFSVADDVDVGSRLVVGTAHPGMVGLSAVDYLVTHAESTQVGAVTARGLPDITPFTDGRPRYPTRLYTVADADLTVLLSEVFLPVGVGEPFVDGLLSFVDGHGIEEVTVVHGVPFPHGPDEHAVFYVATDGHRTGDLERAGVGPLRGGFFDGAVGELVSRGLDDAAPPVGVLVTPAHPPGPDLDGALLVLEAVSELYRVTVDEAELRQRADELRRHYQELADRMQSLAESELPLSSREYPEDRMFG